jgi:hypothetical protein
MASPYYNMTTPTLALAALLAIGSLGGLTACPEAQKSQGATVMDEASSPPHEGTGSPPNISEVRVTNHGGSDTWRPDSRSLIEQALFDKHRFKRTEEADQCKAEFNVYFAIVSNRKRVDFADFGTAQVGVEGMVHCRHEKDIEAYRVELRKTHDFTHATAAQLQTLFLGLLSRLATDAADQLFGQVAVRHTSDSQILKVLRTKKHTGMLMEAAIEAGERRLTEALPLLISLTTHTDPVIRLRAAAALGLLRVPTREVVRSLAKLTEGGQREQIIVAVGALSDIGSESALRYLENIAVSHPDEVVQGLARSGVQKIKSKQP